MSENSFRPLAGISCDSKNDGKSVRIAASFLQDTRFFMIMQGERGDFRYKEPEFLHFFCANPLSRPVQNRSYSGGWRKTSRCYSARTPLSLSISS